MPLVLIHEVLFHIAFIVERLRQGASCPWNTLQRTSTQKCEMLQCVAAVCCGVLQCVAVCCSVRGLGLRVSSSLQLRVVAACCSASQCVAVCCSVLQCVAVCCSVLQCAAVCCSVSRVLQCERGKRLLCPLQWRPSPCRARFVSHTHTHTNTHTHKISRFLHR